MNISENVIKLVQNILQALEKMRPIYKFISVLAALLAAAAFILGLTSCGNISKIQIKSDPNDIHISVSQSTHDSTHVNVNVNPTLRLYGKENETKTE